MQYYGQGYCNNDFYAGWDGHGDNSVEDCKNLCLKDSQCLFTAYYSGTEIIRNGRTKTCSRYKGGSCHLLTSTSHARGHVTFSKGGCINQNQYSEESLYDRHTIKRTPP